MSRQLKIARLGVNLLVFALCFMLSGCSETDTELSGIFSDPKSGRLLDFGPQGLFALKGIRHVVVGRWHSAEEDQLQLDYLSYPDRGKRVQKIVSWGSSGVRFDTPGATQYEVFTKEPIEKKADKSLVGLWKHENEDFLELTEYTPWGTVIWVRRVKTEEQLYAGGGWAKFETPRKGRLHIQGMEYNYDVNQDNQFSYTLNGSLLTLKSKKLKWKKRYFKAGPADLSEAIKNIEALSEQNENKKDGSEKKK